jgi:hypothetical protein
MSSPYFESSPRWVVEECFDFPLDYVVNTPTLKADYRSVLTIACDSPYVKAMLSPRWFITEGRHDVYSTTVAQISDTEVRKQVLQGVGLAHRTLGEDFTDEVFKLFGMLVGSFLMAETFYQIDVGFFKGGFQQLDEPRVKPYDFKPFYLSMFIGQLEMHYPERIHKHLAPQLCKRLRLPLEEVANLALRVRQITGRPKLTFTLH